MCGIVGYITSKPDEYIKARRGFFKYALMLDTLRGPDSTGVISLGNKFKVDTFRTLAPGFTFAPSKSFEENVPNGWCLIGHNRAATVGKVSLENAHPFKFGAITLVHNGTCTDHGHSLPYYNKKLDVDSMQIANALNKTPVTEATTVLESIDGDFCVVWIDERDKSINMARNSGRPMHLGVNYARTFLLFMSDGDHLDIISKALKNSTAYPPSIYSLDTFRHLKWNERGTIKPKVKAFRPFLQAQHENRAKRKFTPQETSKTKANGKRRSTSGSNVTSLTPHTKNTKNLSPNKEAKNDPIYEENIGNRFPINRNITQKTQGTPTTTTPAQVMAVQKYFSLKCKDILEFTPEDFYELNSRLSTVVGVVEVWHKSPWEGTINFVSNADVYNHMHQTWAVRPIGLTRHWSFHESPGILLELVSINYKEYSRQTKEIIESSVVKSSLVTDPDGRLVNLEQISKKIDNGCIECGETLYIGQLHTYIYANEGRDLLCERCRWKEQFGHVIH